jgi:ribose transport system substrate-binding protein
VRFLNKKQCRIGYAAQAADSPFSAAVSASLRWAAAANDLDLIELDNRYSAKAAIRNAERLIAERVDLAIEFQTYEKVASSLGKLFQDAGIPMIAVEIPHPGATYFGIDNYAAGTTVGRYLAKAAKQVWNGEVDEVLLLGLEIAGSVPRLRLAGIQAALTESLGAGCPIHILDTRGEFSLGFAVVRKHLKTGKARRTLMAGVNDPCVLGGLRAFEEAGRNSFCLAAGMGAILEARQELRRKESRMICSLAFFPERYGEGLCKLASEILTKRVFPTSVHTHTQTITRDNVDKFYPTDGELQHEPLDLR